MLALCWANLFIPANATIPPPQTVTVQVMDGAKLVYSVVVSGTSLTYEVGP